MAQIILDISANTHKNNEKIIKFMIDLVKKMDSGKHEIIFKGQLFKEAPPNIPTDPWIFQYMHEYAMYNGYKCTSSVFDKESLEILLDYEIPFIKIPCRAKVYNLIGYIPRKIPCYISMNPKVIGEYFKKAKQLYDNNPEDKLLFCIPRYPAPIEEYITYYNNYLYNGISDHTIGLELWYKYKPPIWEKHYVLEHDKNNPDGGTFAITPKELEEIL